MKFMVADFYRPLLAVDVPRWHRVTDEPTAESRTRTIHGSRGLGLDRGHAPTNDDALPDAEEGVVQ